MATSPSTSNQLTARQQYGLEHLAEHLKQAQQYERLRLLFASDEWMRIRVTGSDFMYSGFLNDLEIAWAAFSEADETAHACVTSLSTYIRLDMIGSSITSLSTRPINLLVNAVATGCWVPARALAVAARNPSRVERITVYTGLLMIEDLDPDARDQIQQLVCRTVVEASDMIPMRFLTRLLPCLKGAAFEVILAQIMRKVASTPLVPTTQSWLSIQFTEEDRQIYTDEAISLLEHIPADQRAPILERIAEAILTCMQRVAAKLARPKKEDEAANDWLTINSNHILRSINSERENPEVLGRQLQQIAPYVQDSPSMDFVLAYIVEALEITADPVFHRLVVSAYAPVLHDDLLDRVVTRVLELSQSPVLPKLLAALAPHLDEDRMAYVSERVIAFVDERQRTVAIDALARGVKAGTRTARTTMRDQADSVSDISSFDADDLPEALASPSVTHFSSEQAGRSDSDILEQLFKPGGHQIIEGAEKLNLRVGSQMSSLNYKGTRTKGIPALMQRREHILAPLVARTFPNLDFEQMARAASPSLAQDESSATTQEDQIASRIFRLYAQGQILIYAPYMSDTELYAAIEDSLDPNEMLMTIRILDLLASRISEEAETEGDARFSEICSADKLAASVRRVKGAILCRSLKLAYQSPLELSDPWQTLPTSILSEADLSIVLNYVLTLPVEVERNQFVWMRSGQRADERTRCLLLKGFEPLLAYLDPPLLERAFAYVNALTNVRVREQALNLIAPYLSSTQLESVLAHQAISDTTELAQLLASLAPLIPEGELESVHAWVVAAALEGANGELLGELLGNLLIGVNSATQEALLENALAKITRRPPNDRLDALLRLAHKWPDPLPRPLIDALLRLPAENERGTYTWLGSAILTLMDRFPDETLPEVWEVIQTLPPYLRIGEPNTAGWHWSYSYPYAAALYALVPRVTGTLLEEVFTAACALYWDPREAIMQQIAEKASGELASRVLDLTLSTLEGYRAADLSATTLWRDECAIYPGSIGLFRVAREVASAEVIAALAPKLSTGDLKKVVLSLHSFVYAGPRAWLPGRLLPYLSEEQQRQILPEAMIAALGYIVEDPTRFDLITALLPFFRSVMGEEVVPLRELARKYFPDQDEIFLTPEKLDLLSTEDRAIYSRLTEKYYSPLMREVMHRLEEDSSDDDKRRLMEQTFLAPLFGAHLELAALYLLLQSPPQQWIPALPELKQTLKPDQLATLVSQTFDELLPLQRENTDQFTDSLIGLLPYLPANQQETLLEIALSLEPRNLPQEDELEVSIYKEILRELPERLSEPSDESPRSLVATIFWQKREKEKIIELIGQLYGNRESLLAALLPHLDSSLTAQLVNAVLTMPENQRIGAIFILMPHLSPEQKAQAHENILTMQSAFGRTWLIWTMSEYFSDEQRRVAVPAALAAVRELRTPEGRVVALCGLQGLVDDDTRRQMLQWILDTLGQIEEVGDRLHILSLFVLMAQGQQELLARAVEIMLQLQGTEWRTQLLVLFCKAAEAHGSLGHEFFARARAILIEELHDSAKLKRSSYLRVLRNLRPAFKLLADPDDVYLTAKASREISMEWNWL